MAPERRRDEIHFFGDGFHFFGDGFKKGCFWFHLRRDGFHLFSVLEAFFGRLAEKGRISGKNVGVGLCLVVVRLALQKIPPPYLLHKAKVGRRDAFINKITGNIKKATL